MIAPIEMIIRLVVALILGYIVGLERQIRGQPAGERTHALVAIGSCLFTLVSMYAFPNADPARVASQIVPGLGFLGAGMIIREQKEIHGLTTAAGIWAVGAVGMAIGVGSYVLGSLAALIILLVLISEQVLKLDERLKKYH
jgi:putative Mg2+ transporter-C (MgtC) family protein